MRRADARHAGSLASGAAVHVLLLHAAFGGGRRGAGDDPLPRPHSRGNALRQPFLRRALHVRRAGLLLLRDCAAGLKNDKSRTDTAPTASGEAKEKAGHGTRSASRLSLVSSGDGIDART